MPYLNLVFGIDPGRRGGIAALASTDDRFQVIEVIPTPTNGPLIDLGAAQEFIAGVLADYEGDPLAIIEKVGAMPKQGVTGMFRFGFNTGAWHGVFAGMGITVRSVTPQAWKKAVLWGTAKDKRAAINHVIRTYPDVNLLPTKRSRKFHDGMADAICIAEAVLNTLVNA